MMMGVAKLNQENAASTHPENKYDFRRDFKIGVVSDKMPYTILKLQGSSAVEVKVWDSAGLKKKWSFKKNDKPSIGKDLAPWAK